MNNTNATNNQNATVNMTEGQLKASRSFAEFDKIDPTSVAEKIIGGGMSYKSFDDEQNLAMLGIHLRYGQHKEALLKAAGDTTFSMTTDAYLAAVQSLGFEIAYTEQVKYTRQGYSGQLDQEREETYYLMAHRGLGIVLQWDTYTWENEDGTKDKSRNGGNFYAMWEPNDRSRLHGFGCLSSGGWDSPTEPDWRHNPKYEEKSPDDLVWVGSWDCREGMKTALRMLLEQGTTLVKWPAACRQPFGIFQSAFDYYHPEFIAAKAQGGFTGYKISGRIKDERRAMVAASEGAWIFDIIGHSKEEL